MIALVLFALGAAQAQLEQAQYDALQSVWRTAGCVDNIRCPPFSVNQACPDTFGWFVCSSQGKVTRLDITTCSGPGGGPLSTMIGVLTALTFLAVPKCVGPSSLVTEIGLLTALRDAYFSDAGFNSTLPTEIGRLTALRLLAIHNNQLFGTVPTEFALLTSLANLTMERNRFDGVMTFPNRASMAACSFAAGNCLRCPGNIPIGCSCASTLPCATPSPTPVNPTPKPTPKATPNPTPAPTPAPTPSPTPPTLTPLPIGETTSETLILMTTLTASLPMTVTVSLGDVPATTTSSGSISVSSIAGIAGGIGGVLCVAAAVTLIVWRRRKHAVAPQAAETSGATSEPPSQSQYASIVLSRSELPTYDVGQVAVYSSARAFDDDDDNNKGATVYATGFQ
jgi:hypothetical protein